MNYYEIVVIDYLRADRSIFVNTECCIQLNPGENPDVSGPHWYCDAVACDFESQSVFLCEISYAERLTALRDRLTNWHDNWPSVCRSLQRDSYLPSEWLVRPWLFVPEQSIDLLLSYLKKIQGTKESLRFTPRITPLEMVQPWRYRSWNRDKEATKPAVIPVAMQM